MTRTRQDRRKDFDDFFGTAKVIFTEFSDNNPKAKKFQEIYSFYACPGSRAGGTNNRVVEVFWGSRPFETITQGRSWSSLSEYGATLLYERDDDGFVIISIYPAKTDNRKPIESSITLGIWIDPIKLKDKTYLKSNWNDLMAYMENTSLEGNPTFFQRQRISYLRTFKNLIIENKWTPTKFSIFIKGVFKLVLAACFSGAVLIYLVNLMTKPSTTETDNQLKEVNKNLENVSKQLDKISESKKDISSISRTADTIVIKSKEILEAIKKP